MQVYTVLIIGAGNIGAFFDTPQSEAVLTHAHAFSTHPGYRLAGFVDADRRLAERAAALWGGKPFISIGNAFAEEMIDVAVVAVPDECHFSVLRELATCPVKLVFVEKPLATTFNEAHSAVELFRQRRVSLAVNYSRRYVPEFRDLRDRIAAGEFGKFCAGSGYYGKGTLHNGSHLVDLIRFLLGEVSTTSTFGSIRDWKDDDPSCSAVLRLACGGQFVMQAMDCRCYTIFEADLLFETGRIRLVDAGFLLEISGLEESPRYSNYQVLTGGTLSPTRMTVSLADAAQSLYDHLTADIQLLCTGDDGLSALKICTDILGGHP